MSTSRIPLSVRAALAVGGIALLASEGVEVMFGSGLDQLLSDYYMVAIGLYALAIAGTGRFVGLEPLREQ